MKYRIFTDGGARGNPGPAAGGVVIEVFRQGKWHLKEELSGYFGKATNNQAEYQALLLGLRHIRALNPSELEILLDSELLVNQLNGSYRVKHPELKPLFVQAKALMVELGCPVMVRHIPRMQNSKADALVNQTLDEQS
ncbi:ribonuclease HI family protein [Candidatus Berkelbacteria bacterium]|nr:ribonuclease HI family protein [Candidatus Berkelbacteria bacterium]